MSLRKQWPAPSIGIENRLRKRLGEAGRLRNTSLRISSPFAALMCSSWSTRMTTGYGGSGVSCASHVVAHARVWGEEEDGP